MLAVGGRAGRPSAQRGRELEQLGDLADAAIGVGVRDAARHVLAVQLGDATDAELATAQEALRSAYDTYARLYGPLNRSTIARTGRRDKVTGEERLLQNLNEQIRDVRQGPDGALWLTTSNKDGRGKPTPQDDRVIRILPPAGSTNSPA